LFLNLIETTFFLTKNLNISLPSIVLCQNSNATNAIMSLIRKKYQKYALIAARIVLSYLIKQHKTGWMKEIRLLLHSLQKTIKK